MVFRICIQIISYLLNGYPDSKLSVLSTPIEDYCGLWKPENAKLRNICNRSESGINGKLRLYTIVICIVFYRSHSVATNVTA